MGETPPIVYLLNGDDEFAIAKFVSELEQKLGDPATASMNTFRMDGSSFNPDQLPSIANALPFLAPRRLIILTNPTAKLNSQEAQKNFTDHLDRIPPTTAIVLVENRLLTSDKDREKGKVHWLERWALDHKEKTFVRTFRAPKGVEMVNRIQDQAKKAGGRITTEAANLLASLVDQDPRLADQEVEKLLAYVGYRRTIEIDDVEAITSDTGQGDIFSLVDALGMRDGQRAMGMLQRLLEYQDYYSLFGMIVRQFRLLILAREVMDRGGQIEEFYRECGRFLNYQHFVARKVFEQARRFALPELEQVYFNLLELDEAVKTSQMPDRLALEAFATSFTALRSPLSSYSPLARND